MPGGRKGRARQSAALFLTTLITTGHRGEQGDLRGHGLARDHLLCRGVALCRSWKVTCQILLNLPWMPSSFAKPGDVIAASGDGEAGVVRLRVRGGGAGIRADRLDRNFESFARVQPGRTRIHAGYGSRSRHRPRSGSRHAWRDCSREHGRRRIDPHPDAAALEPI